MNAIQNQNLGSVAAIRYLCMEVLFTPGPTCWPVSLSWFNCLCVCVCVYLSVCHRNMGLEIVGLGLIAVVGHLVASPTAAV